MALVAVADILAILFMEPKGSDWVRFQAARLCSTRASPRMPSLTGLQLFYPSHLWYCPWCW